MQVVEYMTATFGQECFEYILKNPILKFSADEWQFFLENDSVGNLLAGNFKYGDSEVICSPTTLRYVKVLIDIVWLFDLDKIKTVTEVGIGYGGQCRILMNALPIERYNLVDLRKSLRSPKNF